MAPRRKTVPPDALAKIDERIAALSAQRDQLEGQIAGLRMLRKSIDWKIHGRPARKLKQRVPAGGPPEEEDDDDDNDTDESDEEQQTDDEEEEDEDENEEASLSDRIVAFLRRVPRASVIRLAAAMRASRKEIVDALCDDRIYRRPSDGTFELAK